MLIIDSEGICVEILENVFQNIKAKMNTRKLANIFKLNLWHKTRANKKYDEQYSHSLFFH